MTVSFRLPARLGVSLGKSAEVYKRLVHEHEAMLLLRVTRLTVRRHESISTEEKPCLPASQPHQQLQLARGAQHKTYRTPAFASAVAHETAYSKCVNFVTHKRT